ncbi:MAG: hypothetical protein QW203_07940, partial [Thermoplasmatales archaeon]
IDLGNIRFSSDQAGNNLLYAWLESAPQGTFTQGTNVSSYTSSNVWVNLGNNVIPANGSLTIYMQVLAAGTEFDGVYWGANPLWTSTYGQYDNGAKVFSLYVNGNTPISDFTVTSGFTLAQATSVVYGSATINALELTGYSSGAGIDFYLNTASLPASQSYIAEGNGQWFANSHAGDTNIVALIQSPSSSPNAIAVGGVPACNVAYFQQEYITAGTYNGCKNLFGTAEEQLWVFGSLTYIAGSTTFSAYSAPQLYSTSGGYSDSSTNPISSTGSNIYLGIIGNQPGSNPANAYWNWLRARVYPPNGTDPVLTSIILLVGNYTSASIPSPEWSVLSGKPYITVSAKGISNGLSNIPNDGADFGPDTLLGASSPNQYGPPYTQTSGIQEAINYVTSLPDTMEIVLLSGTYNITAPFVEYGTAPSGSTLPGRYGLINVMPVSSLNQIKMISIRGAVSLPMGSGGSLEPISSSSGAIINILTPALTSTGTPMVIYQTLFYVPSGIDKYTSVSFQNIMVTQPAPCNIGAYFDGQTFLANSYANNLWVGPTNEYNNYFSGIASTNAKATAYNFNGAQGNLSFLGILAAQQMYSAFGGSCSHVYIGSLVVQSCIHGIDFTDYLPYGFAILGFDVQGTQYPIYQTATGYGPQSLFIGTWQEEDYTGQSGITSEFATAYDIYATGGALAIFIALTSIHRSFVPSGYQITPRITGQIANISIGSLGLVYDDGTIVVSPKQYLSPTISANPPVSATVYQNTNPYDIRIYLPAYATTSGTAGSVTIALGSSSSPSTIGTKFINGSTSSSATEIIELVVPAGWYYEFTATGVTFATATVLPA